MTKIENDFTIEELLSLKQISKRAFQCCKINKIQNLSDIIACGETKKRYSYFVDFDHKVQSEFLKLYKQHVRLKLPASIDDPIELFSDEHGNFPYAQYHELQKHYNQWLLHLSIPTRRFLAEQLAQRAYRNTLDFILDEDFIKIIVDPIGGKTEAELQLLRQNCMILTGRENPPDAETVELQRAFSAWILKASSGTSGRLTLNLNLSVHKNVLDLIMAEEFNVNTSKGVSVKGVKEIQKLRLNCINLRNKLKASTVE